MGSVLIENMGKEIMCTKRGNHYNYTNLTSSDFRLLEATAKTWVGGGGKGQAASSCEI